MENNNFFILDNFETFCKNCDNGSDGQLREQKSCSGSPEQTKFPKKLSKFKDFVGEEKKDDKKNNDNGDSESEFEDDDDRIREYDGDSQEELHRRCIPLSMGPMPSTSIY